MPTDNEQKYTTDHANEKVKSNDKEKNDLIDTDNDGKYRTKGDTSDHGDPRSPYGKKNKDSDTDESDESTTD
jgi:hypothetical protein